MAFTSWNPNRPRARLPLVLFGLLHLTLGSAALAQEVSVLQPELLYNDNPGLNTDVIRDVILRELRRQIDESGASMTLLPSGASVGDAPSSTVLAPEFGITEDRLYLSLIVRDAGTGATLAGASGYAALDIGVFNQVARLYRDIAPALSGAPDPADTGLGMPPGPGTLPGALPGAETTVPPAETPEIIPDVRFTSPQDQVVVRRSGGEVLGITEGGEIVVDYLVLGASSELSLELRRPGFYPRDITVAVDPPTPVQLPALKRATRVVTFLGWSPQQALGLDIGGRYYLQPDTSFLQGEMFYHLQGDFESGVSGTSNHFDLRVSGGRYLFFEHESWFRTSVEAALGIIYTGFPGRDAPAYWDPYLTPVALTLEVNGTNVSIFGRFESRFALSGARSYFESGIIEIPGQDVPLFVTLGILSKW